MSNENVPEARFRLNSYLISEVKAKFTGDQLGQRMSIQISPEGEFKREDKKFVLTMAVKVFDDKGNMDLNMKIKGFFEYQADDMDELRSMIGYNAPAILFPYIRAYVSSMTALSGINTVMIPTLNMVSLGQTLLEKMDKNENGG